MKTAIVKKDDMSLASKYEGSARQSEFGGPWSDSSLFEHVEYDESVLGMFVKAQDDGQGGIEIVEDVQPRRDAKLFLMRDMRDVAMKDVDIMCNELATGDRADQAAVKLYRDQLLGLTDAYKDGQDPMKGTSALDALEDDLSDLVMPAKP